MRKQDHSDAWRDLDKQVALMYASVADLKTRRNSLAPIARLPLEILTDIFMFVINLNHAYPPRNAIRYLRLIGVCRYWHSMIMDSPRLWSSLLFGNAELTAHMLQRSKLFPLVVRTDLATFGADRDALKLALFHTSRIRVLQIRAVALDELLSKIDQPAPLLEFLRLANWTYSTITLPPLLFQGVTPRLRHFVVYDINVPWHQLPRGLVHLEIRHYEQPYPPTHGQSLSAFCNVLSHCPALATLILYHGLPYAREDQHQSQCPVTLPRLSHLQLVGDMEDCSALIRLISFPPTTTVVLRCTLDDPPLPDLLQVLSKLGAHGIHFHNGSIRIGSNYAGSYARFQLWTNVDGNLNPLGIPLLDLSFVGDLWFQDTVESASIIHAICQGLSLTSLPRLEIDFSQRPEFQPLSWLTMFSCLDQLKSLTVTALGVDWLITALDPTRVDERERLSLSQPVFLPRLRWLTLHGAHVAPRETLKPLLVCLVLRQEMDAEIESLNFSRCFNLYSSQVKELTHKLRDVTCILWDGLEQEGKWDDDDDEGEEEEEPEYYEWESLATESC
jgi:hypothetical protein